MEQKRLSPSDIIALIAVAIAATSAWWTYQGALAVKQATEMTKTMHDDDAELTKYKEMPCLQIEQSRPTKSGATQLVLANVSLARSARILTITFRVEDPDDVALLKSRQIGIAPNPAVCENCGPHGYFQKGNLDQNGSFVFTKVPQDLVIAKGDSLPVDFAIASTTVDHAIKGMLTFEHDGFNSPVHFKTELKASTLFLEPEAAPKPAPVQQGGRRKQR